MKRMPVADGDEPGMVIEHKGHPLSTILPHPFLSVAAAGNELTVGP